MIAMNIPMLPVTAPKDKTAAQSPSRAARPADFGNLLGNAAPAGKRTSAAAERPTRTTLRRDDAPVRGSDRDTDAADDADVVAAPDDSDVTMQDETSAAAPEKAPIQKTSTGSVKTAKTNKTSQPGTQPGENSAEDAAQALGRLGIKVSAAEIAALPPEGMRELSIALRAAVKGLSEGQSVDQVAQVVSQLLPVELSQQMIPPQVAAVQDQPAEVTADDASTEVLPQPAAEDAASAARPSDRRQNQEISRLSATLNALTDAAASDKNAPTVVPGLSAQALAAGMEGDPTAVSVRPADGRGTSSGKDPRAELSAFLRLDAVAGQAVHETTTAETARPAPFRSTGAAGEILAHQVYDEFQFRSGQDQREMVLKLWPREMGEVSVRVRVREGERVEAKILVQNDTIRQALLEHTPVLRECLAKQGLELGNLSVSVGGGNAQGQEQAFQQGRNRGGHSWENGIVQTESFVPAGVDTGHRSGFNSIDVLS